MTHKYEIKRSMWNTINISWCERISEIDSVSITFGTTISKNYKGAEEVV